MTLTLHKEHLLWQQMYKHERRDRFNFKHSRSDKYYDIENNEKYLTRMNEIKMKTFYGKHPMKYTGDLQPDAPVGINGVYAKLKDTGFRSTADGWKPRGRSQNSNIRPQKLRTNSVNLDNNNNSFLQSKLIGSQNVHYKVNI